MSSSSNLVSIQPVKLNADQVQQQLKQIRQNTGQTGKQGPGQGKKQGKGNKGKNANLTPLMDLPVGRLPMPISGYAHPMMPPPFNYPMHPMSGMVMMPYMYGGYPSGQPKGNRSQKRKKNSHPPIQAKKQKQPKEPKQQMSNLLLPKPHQQLPVQEPSEDINNEGRQITTSTGLFHRSVVHFNRFQPNFGK